MKPTTAITWLEHSLEVLVLGAIVTAVFPLYQAIQSGSLTSETWITVGGLIAAFLLNGAKGLISNANFAQAISDLRTDLATPVSPPVVIHNHIPAPAGAPAASPVQPAVPPAPAIDPASMQAYVTSEMPAIPKPTQVTQP